MIGETILHYKILEKLGEGGMGEVYKAQDTKLDRFVALKFLPTQLTATAEEKTRFIQEAKAASAMNHPNVCTIHSIEENDNQLFIVMEFVEGKTLKDKKDSLSEKQILDVGIQVAEGLAAAHEKGIVHRDIKPENIMIRKDGIAQIMDFGLAKLYKESNVSRLTKAGSTVGTMGYMSPEQVQGLDVDHRTDIFSLGVVLYELLAGESPFKGMHETAVMYEIVNVDPQPISTIKENFSPELEEIILECLEKDKDERYQSAKELAKDLRKVKKFSGHRKSTVFDVNSTSINVSSGTTQPSKSSGSIAIEVFDKRFELKKLIPFITIGSLVLTILFVYLYFTRPTIEPINDTIQYSLPAPAGFTFTTDIPAISPDGKIIAFTASDSSGKTMIWLRQLESLNATSLAGTENAYAPFWSYDARFIGFFADGKLKKINLSAGSLQILCVADGVHEGTWGSNNIILFTPHFFSPLYKISADGGVPVQATTLDQAHTEEWHESPQMLPDNIHFLYAAYGRNQGSDRIYVGSLEDDTKIEIITIANRALFQGALFVSPDKLFFLNNNSLMIQKFNLSDFKLSGEPRQLISNVRSFTVAKNIMIVSQNAADETSDLVVFNRQGKQIEQKTNLGFFIELSVSPDENSIAYHRIYGPDLNQEFNQDIWILDRKRGITSRFTISPASDVSPLWSPDGTTIAYASSPDTVYDIYEKKVSGTSQPTLVFNTNFTKYLCDWSSDGRYLLYAAQGDLWALPMTENRKPFKLTNTSFNEWQGTFSPDVHWIAYSSDESGSNEIYVQSFPETTQKFRVSVNGGQQPRWRPDGKELYYISPENILTAVDVKITPQITFGVPKKLFKAEVGYFINMYSVLDDGQHFLINKWETNKTSQPLQVIVNWKSLLDKND
jgi:serine/threonine protein kinase